MRRARQILCLLTVIAFISAAFIDPCPAVVAAKDPAESPSATKPAPAQSLTSLTDAAASEPAIFLEATQPTQFVDAPYRWRLIDDGVGGVCQAILFHPQDASIRYTASSELGGHRWDQPFQRWTSFTDGTVGRRFGHVAALAIDPNDRDVLYFAAGRPHGEVFRSMDRGLTFNPTGLRKGDGRDVLIDPAEGDETSGSRLAVDPKNPAVVYYVSRYDGLFVTTRPSTDVGWSRIDTFTPRGDVQDQTLVAGAIRRAAAGGGLTFLCIDPRGPEVPLQSGRGSSTLYVGVAGDLRSADTPKVESDGGIWRTSDGGQSWVRLGRGNVGRDTAATSGCLAPDGTLYAVVNGQVVVARRDAADLIPRPVPGKIRVTAIAVDPQDGQHLLAAGVLPADPMPALFRSIDGGATWEPVPIAGGGSPPWARNGESAFGGGQIRCVVFEPNTVPDDAGRSQIVWLGDGRGAWLCTDITAESTSWKLIDHDRGGARVAEIVAPVSQPANGAALLAAVERETGFRYVSLSAEPLQTIRPQWTALSTMPVGRPETLPVVEPPPFGSRASQAVATDGCSLDVCPNEPAELALADSAGMLLSEDGGRSWTRCELPAARASKDGSNQFFGGQVTVGSAGGGRLPNATPAERPVLLWWPAGGALQRSEDWGKSWSPTEGLPRGADVADRPSRTIVSDPVDSRRFYAVVGDDESSRVAGIRSSARLFATSDAAKSWHLAGSIEFARGKPGPGFLHLAARPGRSGELWLAIDDDHQSTQLQPALGLHRSTDGGMHWNRVEPFAQVSGFAFGKGLTDAVPSLAVAGRIGQSAGVFFAPDVDRILADPSPTATQTATRTTASIRLAPATVPALATGPASATRPAPVWQRIWSPHQAAPASIRLALREIAVDRQSFGRVFLAGQSEPRGIYYGEPDEAAAPLPVTNLQVQSDGGRVVIEWTDSWGGAYYEVQRAPLKSATDWQTVAGNVWEGRVVDTLATPGVTYAYRVTAANAIGRSEAVVSPAVTAR